MATSEEMAICKAWHEAEVDLSITFSSPFVVVTDAGRHEYLGLVHGFGRKTGTLICLRGHEPSAGHYSGLDNYSISALTDIYAIYNRDLFIETLNDWQWYGEDAAPLWYTGLPPN